ncbi:hypothetical protein V8E36_007521 [Tilletia maclaganii]
MYIWATLSTGQIHDHHSIIVINDKQAACVQHLSKTLKVHVNFKLPWQAKNWDPAPWRNCITNADPADFVASTSSNPSPLHARKPTDDELRAALRAAAAWITGIDPFASSAPEPKLKALPDDVARAFDYRDEQLYHMTLHQNRDDKMRKAAIQAANGASSNRNNTNTPHHAAHIHPSPTSTPRPAPPSCHCRTFFVAR